MVNKPIVAEFYGGYTCTIREDSLTIAMNGCDGVNRTWGAWADWFKDLDEVSISCNEATLEYEVYRLNYECSLVYKKFSKVINRYNDKMSRKSRQNTLTGALQMPTNTTLDAAKHKSL